MGSKCKDFRHQAFKQHRVGREDPQAYLEKNAGPCERAGAPRCKHRKGATNSIFARGCAVPTVCILHGGGDGAGYPARPFLEDPDGGLRAERGRRGRGTVSSPGRASFSAP